MNREQKRREKKKNKKLDINTTTTSGNELYRLLKIFIVVIIIFAVLYLVVGIFITKEIKLFEGKDTTLEKSDTNNDAILANSIFDQKEEEYYAYFYDFNNENTNIASVIASKLADSKVYYIDTSDILNKNFIVKEGSNKDATSLDELKVVPNTVLKINNDKIIGYYEGEDSISNDLS